MNSSGQITRKELAAYFSSPVAFIFLGTFLFVNLFIFFWVEKFFSRNIADVRPLFEWMPILMIFLVASLTMRMWSEEKRSGTIEFLLTLPISTCRLIYGKFSACMVLVFIALLLTLPIPVTVSLLGDLDWGPVLGAYLATIFLAAAYVSIGLYVSSKSDNQIVSLIITVLIGAIFYLLGSGALTPLLGNAEGEFFRLLGTGSRFESITRGVIDFRDIFYYLSIICIFFSLNLLELEKLRWSREANKGHHKVWLGFTTLFIINFIAANFWLHRIHALRLDITQGQIYSISDATVSYLDQLQEPLLIRGYFSEKTHPLLAPLVPRIRDLIREYEIAGGDKVRSEFVDPRESSELEEEANRKYGIKPIPFQISDKYQASLINSYFDIVVQYGDKHEVLNFRDLIEVKVGSETDIDVQLRNPEYDITRTIKKVLYGFQSVDHLFASMQQPIQFKGYISDDQKLPENLVSFRKELNGVLEELKQSAGNKLEVEIIDPQAGDGSIAQEIAENYGFRPMMANLFSPDTFYFYMVLSNNKEVIQVPVPQDLTKEGLQRSMEAGLKRFSSGFLKTVGLYTPPQPAQNPYMQRMGMANPGKQFQLLNNKLKENYTITPEDLKDGMVADDVDLMLVAAPDNLDDKQLFGLDQFLMKGGTVVLSTSPFTVKRTQNSLSATPHNSGLKEWLKHHGIIIKESMVLDPQNEQYPIPVQRNLGGFQVQEIKLVPYPFFIDVRASGMNQENSITGGIPQVTLNWASPLLYEADEKSEKKFTSLLKSSDQSWLSDKPMIIPNFEANASYGFKPGENRAQYVLAGIVEGSFESYFAGKDSPLLKKEEDKANEEQKESTPEAEKKAEEKPVISGIIDKSASSARIVVFASNEFISDDTLRISAASGTSRFLNSLQLVENTLDWSIEDRGLLSIRSRGHFTRTLEPLSKDGQMFWEYANYILALLGLLLVYIVYRIKKAKSRNYAQAILAS